MSQTSTSHAADLHRFAVELSELRLRAGKPGYRQLAERTRFGRTVLSQALNGSRLPSWEVTRALVLALGGDEREWRERWARVAVGPPYGQAPEPAPRPPGAGGPAGADPAESAGSTGSAGPDRGPDRAGGPDPVPAAPPARDSAALGGAAGSDPRGRTRWWGRRGPWTATAAVLALIVAVLAVALAAKDDPAGPPAAPDTRAAARSGPTETCFEVVAEDVRVFTEPRSRSSWSSWRTGTLFWGAREAAVADRLRVPLRNGSPGWVTANPEFVRPSTSCP